MFTVPWKWPRTLAVFLFLAVCAATATFLAIELGGGASSQGAASNRIVLYAEGSGSDLPALANVNALAERGVRVVNTNQELRLKVNESTRAILLTPATAKTVDAAWIRELTRAGLLLGGINVPAAELGAIMDWQTDELIQGTGEMPSPFTGHDPPAGGPYLSLLSQFRHPAGGGYLGIYSDRFYGADTVLSITESKIAGIERAQQ